MKIAVYLPENVPHSVRSYVHNLEPHLAAQGVTLLRYHQDAPLTEAVDLYWDVRAGRRGPHPSVQANGVPYVVTFHGAALLVLPLRHTWRPWWKAYTLGIVRRWQTRREWVRAAAHPPARIITVSAYAQRELREQLGYESVPIHHGVNHDIFRPSSEPTTREYLLHVSSVGRVKNMERCLQAYHALDLPQKPPFVIISGGRANDFGHLIRDGVQIETRYVPHEELVRYYQGALGFVFPSFRETFGMPILEAMASGCPVIASDRAGCAEISGDAALLVDPDSVESIRAAMQRLIEEAALRDALRQKGLAHVAAFTWERSAAEHAAVFQQALDV